MKQPAYSYDLHMHSVYSDGRFNYAQLAQMLKERGVKGFAVTDHNCCIGNFDVLKRIASEQGMEALGGTELKGDLKPLMRELGIAVQRDSLGNIVEEDMNDILCYGLNPNYAEFQSDRKRHLSSRLGYFRQLCELLKGKKVGDIDQQQSHPRAGEQLGDLYDKVYQEKAALCNGSLPEDGLVHIGGADIIAYITDRYDIPKKFAKDFIIRNSRQARSMCGLDESDPFYSTDVRDIIEKAKRYGKVAVLAHPFYKGKKHMREVYDKALPALVEAGLDGMECSYPDHDSECEETVRGWQKRFGFSILTGGTDFHMPADLQNLGTRGVDQETFAKLKQLAR